MRSAKTEEEYGEGDKELYTKICRQRELERRVRKAKTEAEMLEVSGDSEGAKELRKKAAAYNKQLREYCQQNGLKYRDDRIRTYGKVTAKKPEKDLTGGENGGIIKVGSEGVTSKINDDLKAKELVKLGTNYHNRNQVIYEYSQRVKPCVGFEDVFIHGTPDCVFVYGNENDEFSFTADTFAEILRNANSYSGGNIRLVACQTGAKEGGFAQQLANIMHVSVLAPTEVVNMDGRGNLFVTDNEIVADIWYGATDEERAKMKETGKWVLFKPNER